MHAHGREQVRGCYNAQWQGEKKSKSLGLVGWFPLSLSLSLSLSLFLSVSFVSKVPKVNVRIRIRVRILIPPSLQNVNKNTCRSCSARQILALTWIEVSKALEALDAARMGHRTAVLSLRDSKRQVQQ